MNKKPKIKICGWAVFNTIFHHETLEEGLSPLAVNVLRLGEGCLTESSKFAECLWQLLPNRCYVLGGLSALNLI